MSGYGRRAALPASPTYVHAASRGVQTNPIVQTVLSPRAEIADDFTDLDAWNTIVGTPTITSGKLTGEAVVLHKSELLTDDMRVSAVIGTGGDNIGKTRLLLCADADCIQFYGLEIETGILNNYWHFLKGTTALSLLDGGVTANLRKFGTTSQTVDAGDDIMFWYDEATSTLRAYKNGVPVCSLPVPRGEILHGPGYRHHGIAQGVDLFLGFANPGVQFTSYMAEDATALPQPDAVDRFLDETSLDHWTVLDDGVAIKQHLFAPNSIGPDNVLYTDAAIRYNTELSSDSGQVTLTVANYGAGKFTVAMCSNAGMTDWLGIQFETGLINNKVHAVVGTGPSDYTYVGEWQWEVPSSGEVFSIVYDDTTNTISCYPGRYIDGQVNANPILRYEDEDNDVTHGSGHRYTGMLWETSLFASGVEPTAWEVYSLGDDGS